MKKTPDYYRIASEFFLCETLPQDYADMDDDELNEFLEEHAWEPFEYWNANDIAECILDLSYRMKRIARDSANEAIKELTNNA